MGTQIKGGLKQVATGAGNGFHGQGFGVERALSHDAVDGKYVVPAFFINAGKCAADKLLVEGFGGGNGIGPSFDGNVTHEGKLIRVVLAMAIIELSESRKKQSTPSG